LKDYIPLIAHRGESFDAPENTLAAINLAWERGALAVEVDVHLTADNQICVIHDKTTERTAGKRMVIKGSVMAQLKKFDAGLWKGEKWRGEPIPTLTEVLKTVPANGKLVVEIKSSSKILDKLKQEIELSGLRKEQVEIIAFSLSTIAAAKKLMPEHKMLWLIELLHPYIHSVLGKNPKSLIKYVKARALDGVNVGDCKYFTHRYISELKQAQLDVYTWTVNNPQRAKQLLDFGVDWVTTDRPSWMRGMLRN
jgi:glycerophosphoryl diester phosphodiesterase